MPITYRIDHEAKVVIARGYGRLTDGDVFGYQRDVWSGSDLIGYNELVDFTHVAEIDVPSGDRVQTLAAVAARMDTGSAHTRFAIVAPGDLAYGLGRMFQTYRGMQEGSHKEVGVFRTLPDALAFLGISELRELPPLPPGIGPS